MKRRHTRYRVIFRGEMVAGREPRDLYRTFSALLSTNTQHAASLFDGRSVTIRRDLSADAAQKLQRALRRAGAVCHIEPPISTPPPVADQRSGSGRSPAVRASLLAIIICALFLVFAGAHYLRLQRSESIAARVMRTANLMAGECLTLVHALGTHAEFRALTSDTGQRGYADLSAADLRSLTQRPPGNDIDPRVKALVNALHDSGAAAALQQEAADIAAACDACSAPEPPPTLHALRTLENLYTQLLKLALAPPPATRLEQYHLLVCVHLSYFHEAYTLLADAINAQSPDRETNVAVRRARRQAHFLRQSGLLLARRTQ